MAGMDALDPRMLMNQAQGAGLERLAERTRSGSRYTEEEAAAIRTQAKQFEAVFAKMMVDAMRKNVPESELAEGENDSSRSMYQGMLDAEYAQSLANHQGFGIADAMLRQLGVEPGETDTATSALSLMLGKGRVSTGSGKQALMANPVAGAISSPFGLRSDPINGEWREHDGIDIATPVGQPVLATMGGTVVYAGERAGYGKVVEIDHGKGLHTLYGHLNAIDVAEGDVLRRGESLGKSGNSGRSTGPHLHFEVREDGRPVDPGRYLGPR